MLALSEELFILSVALLICVASILLIALLLRCAFHLEAFKRQRVESSPAYNLFSVRPLARTDLVAPSVEDFRFVAENIIILSAGNLADYYAKGEASAGNGRIVAIDLITETSRDLALSGFPSDKAFRPHGIDFSTRTRRLYVVNHANSGEERVEIFLVSGVERLETIQLEWQGCLLPPVPAGTLNAVTEATDKDVYVTQWLPFRLPMDGTVRPRRFIDRLIVLANYGHIILGRALGLAPFSLRFSRVIHCNITNQTYSTAWSRLVSGNGIASSPDGKVIFVVDCMRQFLGVFERDLLTGQLKPKRAVDMPHTADNVMLKPFQFDSDQLELWFGTIPDWMAYMSEALKRDKRRIPGGFMIGRYDVDDPDLVRFEDVFIHDGSVLPAVATAARWRDNILLSGAKATGGVLICNK